MKINLKLFYSLAIVLGLASVFSWLNEMKNLTGWLLASFFLIVSIICQGVRFLKGLSFTVVIFSVVTIAVFHPTYFVSWNGFVLSSAIIPLIQLLMFGMGSTMSLKDFEAVVKSPKAVIIGVLCQFTIMPLLGMLLASVTKLPSEIAAGIVLIGCSPSGLASNVMAYLAKANLALSVTVTSITTLIAPVVTPLLMKLIAGAYIEINTVQMMWDIFKMILIPIGAGVVFNQLIRKKSHWLNELMPFISMFSIASIVLIITAAGANYLKEIGFILIISALIHNLFGYFLGYWVSKSFRLPERDCRTIAIEVGMQNAGLASGIAKQLGKVATVGLAAAVFGPLMNITGSILASWWHNRNPDET